VALAAFSPSCGAPGLLLGGGKAPTMQIEHGGDTARVLRAAALQSWLGLEKKWGHGRRWHLIKAMGYPWRAGQAKEKRGRGATPSSGRTRPEVGDDAGTPPDNDKECGM
jgi:hypothetical protein